MLSRLHTDIVDNAQIHALNPNDYQPKIKEPHPPCPQQNTSTKHHRTALESGQYRNGGYLNSGSNESTSVSGSISANQATTRR